MIDDIVNDNGCFNDEVEDDSGYDDDDDNDD